MKKIILVIAALAVVLLVGTVSATGPISFDQNGKIVVTFVSKETANKAVFGISSPVSQQLGFVQTAIPGTTYTFAYTAHSPVTLYMKTEQGYNFYSDGTGYDAHKWGIDHVHVTKNSDIRYTVAFEDWYGTDQDWNDAILTVALVAPETPVTTQTTVPITTQTTVPPVTPVPEFPSFALPMVCIIGLLGATLVIRKI